MCVNSFYVKNWFEKRFHLLCFWGMANFFCSATAGQTFKREISTTECSWQCLWIPKKMFQEKRKKSSVFTCNEHPMSQKIFQIINNSNDLTLPAKKQRSSPLAILTYSVSGFWVTEIKKFANVYSQKFC